MKPKHQCGIVLENKHVNAQWLAKHFLDQFRMHPNMDYSAFHQMTQNSKFSSVSNHQFYRARHTARIILEGSVKDQYEILEDYCKQLLETNPGSTAKIQTLLVDGKRVFEKVYICLKACKDGFIRGCRRLIGLDGCHLKGYSKGILLAAIGIDGANSIFPIAYAVVGKETTESWTWFLELLKEDLHPTDPCIYTMMSDRQKGLQNAVDKIFIGSDVRFCVRHMHGNFKKDFPGLLLKQMLWAAARATTPAVFERKMKELKDVNERAYNWLASKNPSEWSKSHFKESVKCDMLLNNVCESFNGAILDARDKPIVTLLESLRLWLMRKFTKNRENVDKWKNPVHNNIMKILDKQMEISAYCSVERANATIFQVTMNDGKRLTIDLDTHTCTCRRWQLTGLPCGHGLATIFFAKHDVWGYIHSWYHKAAYKAAYEGTVGPVPSPDNWPNKGINPILPPGENNLPGRPKKKRILSANEPPPANATKLSKKGQLNHCGNCGQVGHSRRTCKNEVAPTVFIIFILSDFDNFYNVK